MPKSYSDQEKEYIIKRLKEEALSCMAQYGIRRTTVDELVRRVNIPKGTFYLFYKSKELLLFEVIQEQHDIINQNMYLALQKFNGSTPTADELTDLFLSFFKLSDEMPIFRILDSDEVELLMRKLPPEVLANHMEEDTDAIEKIFSMLPVKDGVDVEVVSAAFHSIYFATLHKNEVEKDHYYPALRMIIYGVVTQFLA